MRTCRDGQGRNCRETATVRLITPEGQPIPGSAMCRKHAQKCVDEYRQKLGEEWHVVELGKDW